MPKPLHSESVSVPQSLQFKHFGVLQAGSQSKSSVLTAATINILLAIALVIIGAATTRVIEQQRRVAMLIAPVIQPEPEPVRPKLIPPKIKPPLIVKTDVPPPPTPLPEIKLPDPPKVAEVKPAEPVPVNKPAPPKAVVAPPAPRPVSLAHPEAASIANNSPRPAAVALGRADNPITASNRPATTAAINLGQAGAPGMNSANNGSGPRSAVVNLGSGSPSGQNLTGNGARAVQGVALGRPSGSGPLDSTGRNPAAAGQVNLGVVQQPAMPKPSTVAVPIARAGPKVLFKPRPDYTPEARALHLEGTVSVRLHVSATGVVTILGIGNGLGHGLDESARRAVQATKFQPATDVSGHPIDWDGVVNVIFQMAE